MNFLMNTKTSKRSKLQNNRSYSCGRQTLRSPKKRRLTKEQQGIQLARTCISLYNSLTNRAPGYLGNTRIHHGEIGVLAFGAGLLTDDKVLMGFGKKLILDDIHDINEWFTLKQKDPFQYPTNYNSLNYV